MKKMTLPPRNKGRHRRSWSSESIALIDDMGMTLAELAIIEQVREKDSWIRRERAEQVSIPPSFNSLRITSVALSEDDINSDSTSTRRSGMLPRRMHWIVGFSTGRKVSLDELHAFHRNLKDLFPVEAGEKSGTGHSRLIPSFPKRLFWLGGTCSRERAAEWLVDYLLGLQALPASITCSHFFLNFFTLKEDEGNALVELVFEDFSIIGNDDDDDETSCRVDGKKCRRVLELNCEASFVYCIDAQGDAVIVEEARELEWAEEHGIRSFFRQSTK